MNTGRKVALFGLLTALTLVLGLMDRAIPVSAIFSGVMPGIKLGLANTVLLYAVYIFGWKGAVLLMLAKVGLSGFLFGSLTAILYSLSGGVLSLAVMLLVRRRPGAGALAAALAVAAAEAWILVKTPRPAGDRLTAAILTGVACLAAVAFFVAEKKGKIRPVVGTSIAGAIAHNAGQVVTASLVLHSPMLLMVYLPILAGVGACVGCLTGIVTERVLKALRINPMTGSKEKTA